MPALIGVGAAILGGFAGFALRASNTILPATTTVDLAVETLPYYECPGFAAPAGAFHTDDRVFALAQDSTGKWLEVRADTDLSTVVWVEKEGVTLDRATPLPVQSCSAPGGTAVVTSPTASPTPGSSPTPTPGATPTAAATSTPGATPTPKGAPPPAFGASSANPTTIYEYYPGFGGLCVSQVTSVITVTVSGATSVTMSWNVATAASSYNGSKPMTRAGNTWTATLGTNHIFDQNTIGNNDHEPITIAFSAIGAGGTRHGSGPTVTLINASACGV